MTKTKTKVEREKRGRNVRTKFTMALADEIIAEIGCHPVEVLLRGAAGDWEYFGFAEKSMRIGKATVRDNITFEDRVSCAEKAAKYVAPQLKAVEHSGEIGGNWLANIINEIDGSDDESED